MGASTQQKVLGIITAALLALTYFAAGFAVCAGVPAVTEQLATRTARADLSPFEREQLTSLAVATRDYTVGAHDQSALAEALAQANRDAGTPYTSMAPEELLAQAPDEYALDEAALAHLDDVNEVTSRFFMPILGAAVLAGFCIMAGYRMFGSRMVARALIGAGAVVLAVLAVLGIWGIFGFNGLFSGMHALFFQSGTWVFPVDSLLICMYPQTFWMGMGAVWLSTSCLLAALSIAGGAIMLRRERKRAMQQEEQPEPASGDSRS